MSDPEQQADDGSIEAQLAERRQEVEENEPGTTPGDDESS